MSIRPAQVLARAGDYLDRHGVENARGDAELLLMDVLGVDRAGLYAGSAELTPDQARAYGRALCDRCAGVPLQHLTGEQPFRHLVLEVRPGVFIPRPETEILVDVVLEGLTEIADPVVADIGTGTGAIALSIRHERPDARVCAVDASAAAVALARANATRLGLDIEVFHGDLLDPLPPELRGRIDALVSNPPYVTEDEYRTLSVEVLADPVEALVGGTQVHRALAEAAADWLAPGGFLAMEIGATQADEVSSIVGSALGGAEVVQDLAERDRIVVGSRA